VDGVTRAPKRSNYVLYKEEALRLTPNNDPSRPKILHNLSLALDQRFGYTGSTEDIEAAIECSNEAVRLSNPFGRAYCLNGLAVVLRSGFDGKKERDDLTAAVDCNVHVPRTL